MAKFDANTGASVLLGVRKLYDGSVVETLQSEIIDIKGMEAFTFVLQYYFNPSILVSENVIIVTNARITMSDDSGFATSDVVTNIIGTLDDFNIDSSTIPSMGRYFARAGAYGTKRYVRLELDVNYTEDVIDAGPSVLCHVQYKPLVLPESV